MCCGGFGVWRYRRQAGIWWQDVWQWLTDMFVVCPGPAGCLQIPSDKVPFNQLPDMKAYEITEAGKEALRSGKYKMVRQAGAQGVQALLAAARGKGANLCRRTQMMDFIFRCSSHIMQVDCHGTHCLLSLPPPPPPASWAVCVCPCPQVRINYANPDMVGHTGDLKASIHACAVVDKCLKDLLEVCNEVGGR